MSTKIFPQQSIDEMRRINCNNLPSSAELLEEVSVPDGSGGIDVLGWKVYDTKCCRLSSVKSDERIVSGQLSSEVQWWVIFAWDVEIPAENLIRIGDRIFHIIGDLGARSNQIMAKYLCWEDRDPSVIPMVLED